MSNVEIVTNIDIASEIAHATVTEVLANMENERVSYVLMGVLQQIETIQDNVNNFNLKEQDKATFPQQAGERRFYPRKHLLQTSNESQK